MIIFSDLHLHSTHPVAGEDYLQIGVNAMEQVFAYANKTGDKTIICLGDVFQLKDKIPSRVWNAFFRELEKWEQSGIHSYWLMGNHDFQNDITINAFEISPYATPVTVVQTIRIDDKMCGFVPYGAWGIDMFINSDINFMFLHDYIYGKSELHGGLTIRDEGVTLPVDRKWITFAGHAHKFQKIGSNIWHIGSPYHITFNEVGENKYFAHITDKIKFIEFDFPEFKKLEFGDKKTIVNNLYVKVIYNTAEVIDSDAKKYKHYLLNKGARTVKLEPIYQVDVKQRIKAGKGKIVSDKEYIKAYVDKMSGELDKTLLLDIGREIIDG